MDNKTDKAIPAKTIELWVESYSDSLYSWALYKTSDKETAEDLVQETFLAAFQSFEGFKGESKPKTWLFAILNNKIRDYHRKRFQSPIVNEQVQREGPENSLLESLFDSNDQWIKEQRPQEWPLPEENILDNIEFNKIMQQCMRNLPDHWFSAVHLKYLEEKKGEHICQELNISATNFWQILHRAKLQLRKCIELNWLK